MFKRKKLEKYKKRLERIRKSLNIYLIKNSDGEDYKSSLLLDDVVSYQAYDDEFDYYDYYDEDDDLDDDEEYDDEPLSLLDKLRAKSHEKNVAAKEFRAPNFMSAANPAPVEIDELLKNKQDTFSTKLINLIDERGLKDSEVYKRANIDRRLFSKIRGDVDYTPSKKTAISFCLALNLDLDETKELLESAGYTLSNSSRFDLIISYLIENREYNINFVNIVLDEYGEGTLSR